MKYLILTLYLSYIGTSLAQFGYDIIGNSFAVSNINNMVCGDVDSCFTLTSDVVNQSGAVWDNKVINLNYSFDASFCLTLGSNDVWGADGFAFVMRGAGSANIGAAAYGLGALGISPSVIIEFDTWENTNALGTTGELLSDHTTLYFDGDFFNPIAGPTPLLPNSGNVEDGGYHIARIVWNANQDSLRMYFDGNLRLNYHGDIVNNIFSGNNLVTWGFTASTGGVSNLQQICFPKYKINLEDEKVCAGDSIQLHFYNPNLTSYKWTFEDGTVIKDWNTLDFSTPFNLNDTVFFASQPGVYHLDIEINNQLVQDSLTISIIQKPLKPFANKIILTCFDNNTYNLNALNSGDSYLWSTNQTSQQISVNTAGIYTVQITEPLNSCKNFDTLKIINFCKDTTICDNGLATISFYEDNLSSYKWTFEDGTLIKNWNTANFSVPFNLNDTIFNANQAGTYFLDIQIENDIIRDSLELSVIPSPSKPFVEQEIVSCLNQKNIILDAQNIGDSYLWSTGDTVQQINISQGGTYFVEITESINSCKNYDTINIISFCKTEIICPNIFTPNGDSLNDYYELFFSNKFEWIKDFEFEILNRWGEKVYSIKNQLVKWDGKNNGTESSEGVYFYRYSYKNAFSEDKFIGNGNIQLIR